MTDDARAPDFAAIHTGLHIAALLGMPLPIGGRQVEVPAGFRVEPSEIVEDGTPDIYGDAPDMLIVARDCAYLMRCAALEIERFGLDIGALTPLPAPERSRAVPLTALGASVSSVLSPPVLEPEVVERDGAWIVGSIFEVRSSDAGRSWHVVHLDGGLLVSWHPTQAAALAWARQAARDSLSAGAKPQAPHPFTHQPKEQEQ